MKPKIKYRNIINDEQVYEKHKFSLKFCKIVSNYKKTLNDFNDIIQPSTFSCFWKDNSCVPFWNNKIKIISRKIFNPTIDNVKPDIKLKKKFNKNKWFKCDFYKDSLKNPKNNNIRCKLIPNDKKNIIKVVKIKLYCDNIQKRILKQFFGVYRYFYNRSISYFENINKDKLKSYYYVDPKDKTTKKRVTVPEKKNLYSWYFLKKELYKNQPEWLKMIKFDSHSCKNAIKESIIGIKTNLKKKKKFNMKMKTKKDLINTIRIEKSSISKIKNCIFSGYKFNGKNIFRNMKMSDDIKKYNYRDSTISYHRILDRFTLNLTYTESKKENKETKVCSLDPGINNFMTCYGEDSVSKLGINCNERLGKICGEVDIIHSRIDEEYYYVNEKKIIVNANRRRNLRKALHRKIQYIKNLRNELHNQIINYLVSNFGKIITTPFKIQEMATKLSSNIARKMYTLSHYMFRKKLENKCNELNKIIVVRPEYYTSMTCTKCGMYADDFLLYICVYFVIIFNFFIDKKLKILINTTYYLKV